MEIKSVFRKASKQLAWLDQATKDAVEDKVYVLPIIIANLLETSLEILLVLSIWIVGRTSGGIAKLNSVNLQISYYLNKLAYKSSLEIVLTKVSRHK